jgi:Leucine-rich repeat (LRR) protein
MKELNILEFLDKYKVEYGVKNDKVICNILNLSNRGITSLPKDIGRLECDVLDLAYNEIKELPISFGDMRCKGIQLRHNNIDKHNIKYFDLIENLIYVYTDYGDDLLEHKQLCRINSRKAKILSVLKSK